MRARRSGGSQPNIANQIVLLQPRAVTRNHTHPSSSPPGGLRLDPLTPLGAQAMPPLGCTRPRWLIIISRTHAGAVPCLANSLDYQPTVTKLCHLNCGAGFDPSVAEDGFSTSHGPAHAATSFWLPSDYGSVDILALGSFYTSPGLHDKFIDMSSFPS